MDLSWLEVTVLVLAGTGSAIGILRIWLSPLFNMNTKINDLDERVEKIEENQTKDYRARLRNEKIQKAQIKALIALLNTEISGTNVEALKMVRQELQDNLVEHI